MAAEMPVGRVRWHPCAECGARMVNYDCEVGEQDAVCSQCSCLLVGVCDACGEDECLGLAWPQRFH